MDLIFYHGKIYMERDRFAQAMWIQDGVIREMGSDAQILQMAPPKAERIDLDGRLVLPGMNDSHQHLCMVGEHQALCDLSNAYSIAEIQRRCKVFLETYPDIQGLHGVGWNQDYFTQGEKRPPTRQELDEVSEEIPIVLERVCGHLSSGNSKALELAGIGANIGWNNDDAANLKGKILTDAMQDPAHQMGVLWNDAKARFVGKFGAYVDFNVSRRVALGLEVNCNATSDHYNSKRAGNADWYFNALAGVKVKLGKVSKKVPVAPVVTEVVVKADEKPAEKEVKVEVVHNQNAPKAQPREPLRRDIFFAIRSSKISRTEMVKIEDVVEYLNKYPDARVSITGHADKGTGNAKINAGYAEKRAEAIAKLLTCKYGISHLRICMDSKGDTVQPYEQNDLNRVTICIAE